LHIGRKRRLIAAERRLIGVEDFHVGHHPTVDDLFHDVVVHDDGEKVARIAATLRDVGCAGS
jgi:hypothetical protein